MTKWSARLEFITEENQPDDYISSSERYPSPDFVVCRNSNGMTASVFSDDSWDFTAYHPKKSRSILHFNIWKVNALMLSRNQIEIKLDVKWIIFILIFMRKGQPLSFSSLYNCLQPLKHIMRYCQNMGCNISSVLNSPEVLKMLFCVKGHNNKIANLTTMLRNLKELGQEVTGYEIISIKDIDELQKVSFSYHQSIKQHAPIPTRIYSLIISELCEIMDEFEIESEKILEVVNFYIHHPGNFRGIQNLIIKKGLANYFTHRGFGLHVMGLSSLISETLAAASLLLQLFTGMRASEVRFLPYDCLSITSHDGHEHFIINGYTTKLNHGRNRNARWVTSNRGKQAVLVAQKITKVMYLNSPTDESYLFVNILLGNNSGKGLQPLNLRLNQFSALKKRLSFPITDEDLRELENIDLHRNWREEADYQLEAPWPLRKHQFRRSLALYAQRSGLVTLPSLKRQMHHITDEMVWYYSKGSEFANNLFDANKEVKHFAFDWQEAQPLSQYLGYTLAMFFSNDVLFGSYGHWINNQIDKGGVIYLQDREETLKRFKLGQIAYRETAIGGCITTSKCDKKLLDILSINCIKSGCVNFVGSRKKLERILALQNRRVEELFTMAPESPEYRSEKSDLEFLNSIMNKIIKANSRG
ncbi:hypothetical protein H9T43_002180 [Salmonella enterica]|nr:hypothetical protein [Salmonella enterica]